MIVVNTVDIGKPYHVIQLVCSGEGKRSDAEAIDAMIEPAAALNADAVVNVRISYAANQLFGSLFAHHYYAYGTAVRFA